MFLYSFQPKECRLHSSEIQKEAGLVWRDLCTHSLPELNNEREVQTTQWTSHWLWVQTEQIPGPGRLARSQWCALAVCCALVEFTGLYVVYGVVWFEMNFNKIHVLRCYCIMNYIYNKYNIVTKYNYIKTFFIIRTGKRNLLLLFCRLIYFHHTFILCIAFSMKIN